MESGGGGLECDGRVGRGRNASTKSFAQTHYLSVRPSLLLLPAVSLLPSFVVAVNCFHSPLLPPVSPIPRFDLDDHWRLRFPLDLNPDLPVSH